jgi:hypothetical protein
MGKTTDVGAGGVVLLLLLPPQPEKPATVAATAIAIADNLNCRDWK